MYKILLFCEIKELEKIIEYCKKKIILYYFLGENETEFIHGSYDFSMNN